MLKLPYRLSVCGKHEVDDFESSGVTHLLSLEDPGTIKRTPDWFRGVHVQFLFHDVDTPRQESMFGAIAPSREQVSQILEFGRTCLAASRASEVHLLVHCYAGASRSPAVCYALMMQGLGPGHAEAALRQLLDMRPESFPNQLIVKYADDLLQGGGEMVKALKPLREEYMRAVEEYRQLLDPHRQTGGEDSASP